jgi:hypothetical protein
MELAAYERMGWLPRPDTPPAYALFPMFLSADGLPDLIVENEVEAKAAARRGYVLPKWVDIVPASQRSSLAPSRRPGGRLVLRAPSHRC